MERVNVFGTLISSDTFQQTISRILDLSDQKNSSYVCFANVHMVTEAYKDKAFQDMLNRADIVTPDGRPISLFMQYVRGEKQDRVAGMDLMPALMAAAAKANKSVFLIGSTTDIQQLIIEKASKELPDLRIAGAISPPFRPLSEEEKANIVQEINDARPDFIFVSLGCPKQEKWMAEHMDKVNACMLGLGQAFNVYAGTEKRLPKWMRDLSLEWVYRLVLEPKRLWKRYLVNNSIFIWLVMKYILTGGRKKNGYREEPTPGPSEEENN